MHRFKRADSLNNCHLYFSLSVSQNIMAICSDDKTGDKMKYCSCTSSSWYCKEPESGFYREGRVNPCSDEESDEWISEGELSSVSSDEKTASGLSCGAQSEDTYTDGLTTSSDLSQNFEGPLSPVSLHLQPVFCSSCRAQALDNLTDGLAVSSDPSEISDEELKPASVVQNPGPCSSCVAQAEDISANDPTTPPVLHRISDRELQCVPCDRNPDSDFSPKTSADETSPDGPDTQSSSALIPTGDPALCPANDCLNAASALPAHHSDILKRIRKFLSRMGACFHSHFCFRVSKWVTFLYDFCFELIIVHGLNALKPP